MYFKINIQESCFKDAVITERIAFKKDTLTSLDKVYSKIKNLNMGTIEFTIKSKLG